jgi:hypothetical protein
MLDRRYQLRFRKFPVSPLAIRLPSKRRFFVLAPPLPQPFPVSGDGDAGKNASEGPSIATAGRRWQGGPERAA